MTCAVIKLFKNGNWNRTQKHIANHSIHALHNLFIFFNQLSLDIKDKCKLFDSLVGSILNYGSEIYGYHIANDIEIIHTKFFRKILHVRKSTNLSTLYGELGRHPMLIQRKINIIRYWLKILKSDDNKLIKKLYMMLKNDTNNGNNYGNLNWTEHVKQILDELGISK